MREGEKREEQETIERERGVKRKKMRKGKV